VSIVAAGAIPTLVELAKNGTDNDAKCTAGQILKTLVDNGADCAAEMRAAKRCRVSPRAK